jgi:integrase
MALAMSARASAFTCSTNGEPRNVINQTSQSLPPFALLAVSKTLMTDKQTTAPEYLTFYNGRRPHSSLDGKFPFLISSHVLRHSCGYKLANEGQDTRAILHYLGHRSIASTVRYTKLAPDRFKGFWKD